MTEVQKKKAIQVAMQMGYVVSFASESGLYMTSDGHERKYMSYEELLPKLKDDTSQKQ